MAQPAPTSINCPSCGQPFNAIIEQILDTRIDPSVKERLLNGRINIVTCPHCGYQGMVGTPLMYHDHSNQLAIVYVPMELNIPEQERERIIGNMTQAVMRSLPEESNKGYLLQPKTALTLQGLTEQVLEADGITPEMLAKERRKAEFIGELAQANSEQQEDLLSENSDLIDETFFEMLDIVARNASESGDSRTGLRLLNLRKKLLETTEVGQQIKKREQAVQEVIGELQELGDNLNRESFVDLLARHAHNDVKINALASVASGLLDYSTFQIISERIESAETDIDRRALEKMRDRLLEFAAQLERQQQAIVEQATNTLRTLLSAENVAAAVQENLERIDETFLQVLQLNMEEASKSGNQEALAKMQQIRDEVIRLIEASAPPEIQFINQLLSTSSEEAFGILRERSQEITPELIETMGGLVDQLRTAGNEEVAQRLERIAAEAQGLL